MLRTLTLCLAALGFSASAFAGTAFTAKLETPMDKAERVVAVEALWFCDGDTCTAELKRKAATVSACKKVVKEVGKLAQFKSEAGELSAADLEKCNAAAK